MWSIHQILFFKLCFTTFTIFNTQIKNNEFDKINEFIKKNVSTTIRDNYTNVNLQNYNISYDIYTLYNKKENSEVIEDSGLYFYSCMNCIFAHYIQEILYEDTYIYLLYDGYDKNNLILTMKKIMKLVNVLLKFLNIISYPFTNTDFLNILLSLCIKINYSVEKDFIISIIPIFVDVINNIQNFIVFNCRIPSKFNNKNLYGYEYETNEWKKENINTIIQVIEKTINTNIHCCSIEKMLLVEIIDSNNSELNEISNIKIRLQVNENKTNESELTIKENLNDTLNYYSVEYIFLYLKSLFKAIILTILQKLKQILIENNQQKKIIKFNNKKFEDLTFIYLSLTNLPENVISLLNSDISIENEKEINDILNKLNDQIDALNNDNKEKETVLGISKVNIIYEENPKENRMSLEDFLDNIKNYIEDYKCFILFFEYLNNEYKKNYTSTIKNEDKDTFVRKNFFSEPYNYYLIINNDVKHCNITKMLIQNGIEVIDSINNIKNDNDSEYNNIKNYFIKTMKYIKHISNQSSNSYYIKNVDNMDYVMIHASISNCFNESKHDEIKRIVFIIITNLQKFVLEFCSCDHNFFSYDLNNKNKFTFHQLSEIDKQSALKYLNEIIEDKTDKINLTTLNYIKMLFGYIV